MGVKASVHRPLPIFRLPVAGQGDQRDVRAQGVPQLELPSDRRRPPVKNYEGTRLGAPSRPTEMLRELEVSGTNGTVSRI